ncbi:class I SAM-dependent methyltransferase [Bradyrhizobium hipponense]|uniref:Class I SAM-dependent methyltransferase n=1 Tax=Bradyrhizobium hipponense TaxID=2605638 RepID=A0A5S4YL99_9BRAD|nr:class I SAM-dependent methyltransferase [Bradyrhizobium hipponense]TYO61099.1 class I SAM-dependent methyltransferase [Bradyrhizobium hipponense]
MLGGFITNHELVTQLAIFAPNSSGSAKAKANLTILSAQHTFPLFCGLLRQQGQPPVEARPLESFCSAEPSNGDAVELARLFNKYGSDKASSHDYYRVYAEMLGPLRRDQLRILEIGCGTNNRDVVSTMGKFGRPGASLRAFRDFLPNSEIFGADVDRRILFEEDRIKTYFVDQTSLQSLDDLAAVLPSQGLDLIIDDGLHSPSANVATLIFALKKLKASGWFVVEDVAEESVPVWQLVSAVLAKQYTSTILRGRSGFMVVVKKASSEWQS